MVEIIGLSNDEGLLPNCVYILASYPPDMVSDYHLGISDNQQEQRVHQPVMHTETYKYKRHPASPNYQHLLLEYHVVSNMFYASL